MEIHESNAVERLLQQLIESQREQTAAVRQLTAQTEAVRKQLRGWCVGMSGLLLLLTLVVAIAAGSLAVQISHHAHTLFQLWDETYPLDDSGFEEGPPADGGGEHLI
jgi:hypothetical protein